MKRLIDVVGAGLLLALAWPLMLVTALVVAVRLGRPVLFTQARVGRHGRIFRIDKFRSMTDARDAAGQLLPDEVRLTPTGRLLRSTSLDELPQLFAILRGDMSLVGPRPLLPEYLPLYSPWHARRHEVPPGLTGWAQVNGRAALAWDDKLDLDVWYVDHRSLWLDLRILAMTAWLVFRRERTEGAGNVRFTGSTRQGPPGHP